MEGLFVSSEMNERIARDSSFLDKVFSWSINDIFNDEFYGDKVNSLFLSLNFVCEMVED